MSKRRKHIEFSKKILIVAAIVNIVIIIFCMIMVWRTNDLSPFAYLIPSIAAETATGTGFYYTKAKEENRIKLMKTNEVDPTDNNNNM